MKGRRPKYIPDNPVLFTCVFSEGPYCPLTGNKLIDRKIFQLNNFIFQFQNKSYLIVFRMISFSRLRRNGELNENYKLKREEVTCYRLGILFQVFIFNTSS